MSRLLKSLLTVLLVLLLIVGVMYIPFPNESENIAASQAQAQAVNE